MKIQKHKRIQICEKFFNCECCETKFNIHEKWKDTKGLILVKNPLFVDFVTKKYSQSGQVKRHNNDSHW